MPTHITKTSPGNYQVYWVLDSPEDFRVLELIMRAMAVELNIDHTQDVSRVFRLPGFTNCKYESKPYCSCLNTLGVYVGKNRRIGEIKATGKPVSLKPFLRFYSPPKVSQDVKEVKTENDTIVENATQKARQAWDKIDKYMWLAQWRTALIRQKLDECVSEVLYKVYEEYEDKLNAKTYNEADLAIAFRLLKKKKVSPEKVKQALIYVAAKRMKPKPEYYADLTLMKALSFAQRSKKETQTQAAVRQRSWRPVNGAETEKNQREKETWRPSGPKPP